MEKGVVTVVLCVLLYFRSSVAAGIQCLSNNGDPVDWFIAYKLPDLVQVPPNSFFYMDSDQTYWQPGPKTLDQPGHAIQYTLNQIYKHPVRKNTSGHSTDLLYVMYNDQEQFHSYPNQGYASNGHTKGVVAFDPTTGFWLVHSTPKFPPPQTEGYSWPETAKRYGQTFLCISMKTDGHLDIVGKQLFYNYPSIYDHASSTYFDQKFPNMAAVINRKHVTEAPWNSEAELTSLGGVTFLSFAKFSKFEKDLYADWLAPRFKDTLLVETWQDGSGGRLCSNCTIPYKVYNIESVVFKESGVDFKETVDHSKWAITKSQQWACIGDINRMRSQEHRGGGTVCLKNSSVWKSFYNIVNATQDCGACA